MAVNRLDKIKQEFLERFQSKLDEEGVDLSVEAAFDILVSADPSRNKKNVRWLMETYLNDGFLWEDIQSSQFSKVYDTLNVFIRNKNKLDILDRSINRYESIADMWKIVKQYADIKTGKEVKREEHDRAMDESEVVIDNDDMRVVVPLTEYASKFHGRGTRWCTAADNDNMFWSYALISPLFIITLKESGDKLQLWTYGDDIQFMDEDDKNVSKEYIAQNWDLLKDIIKYNGLLEYIPKDFITLELCEIACKRNGSALFFVPDELRTPELCKIACKNNGGALRSVPKDLITPELCKLAVKQNKSALYNTPKDFITPELCELACKQDGRALVFIPDELRTPELCALAVKQNSEALHYVPYKLQIPELCEIAIKQDGSALQYVPEKYKTYELCNMAIEQNGRALQHVPKDFITPELCEIACQTYGKSLKYIPYKIRSLENIYYNICKTAVKQNGASLSYVPYDLITPELCEMAVRQNSHSLEYVPEKLKTPELYELICQQDNEIPTDIYKQEIDKLKEMLISSIEPSQTIHHTM